MTWVNGKIDCRHFMKIIASIYEKRIGQKYYNLLFPKGNNIGLFEYKRVFTIAVFGKKHVYF